MDFDGIGFSDIRMPNDLKNSYMYKYDSRYDTFPEEVFVHEFLHSLERNLKERDYDIPALHDSSKYGYVSEGSDSLKRWYHDYMAKEIPDGNGELIGLDSSVYSTKPVQESNFYGAEQEKFVKEPNNFFVGMYELINGIIKEKNNSINLNSDEVTVITHTE
ncbi:MAG: hypothetical protein IKG42_03685 [Clostridia bacterium]|nr:hypothetical protein [Clostridia bacterium]